MDIAPISVHGWKFHIANDQLWIGSEQDAEAHIKMSAEAAFSLLDYLYRYRDALNEAADHEKTVAVEERRAALESSQSETASPQAESE